MTKKYSPIIGFEVHVELATRSKMFCGCSANHFGITPNSLTCPVCLGLPGALPVPNRLAVEWTILIGLALNCQIATVSKFDRKHYFYPNLAKGYQISQYDQPLCTNGYIDTAEGRIGIERVHLEEDTGKLQHALVDGEPVSLVDFNRSGVPLVEIVTKPEIYSTSQALEYSKKLRQIITALHVSDCDMEKGSMRLEANISWGLDLGYKVEVKNVNSFRFIGKAIDYELARQLTILESGQTPTQETRGWHEKSNSTRSQRTKETAADYRYFPEPDIPPMEISQTWLDQIRSKLVELPEDRQLRWQDQFGLRPNYAKTALNSQQLSALIEQLGEKLKQTPAKLNQAIGWLINKQIPLSTKLDDIIAKLDTPTTDKITDQAVLIDLIEQAITALPKPAKDYSVGVDKAISALIGKVMGLSQGKADGGQLAKLIHSRLRGE